MAIGLVKRSSGLRTADRGRSGSELRGRYSHDSNPVVEVTVVALATTKRIFEVNPLLAGMVLMGIFYLYWFAAHRPLTRIYADYSPNIERILRGTERIFWGVWVIYSLTAIVWGVYSLFN